MRMFQLADDAPHSAHITLAGDMLAVRDGLKRLFAMQPLCDLTEAGRGNVEIVLAEALNNIVEHAYARHSGTIKVALQLAHPDLLCQISDSGLPMPGESLPLGNLAQVGNADDLPEGGFGWFLIRTLTRELNYRRHNGLNLLSFRVEAI